MSVINKAFPWIGAGGGGVVGVMGGSVLFTALGFALLGPIGGAVGLGVGAIGGGTGGIIAGTKCGQAIKKATEGSDSDYTPESNKKDLNDTLNENDNIQGEA